MRPHFATILATMAVSAAAPAVLGQPGPPDYGYTWRTIGDPGNPGTNPADYPRLGFSVGSVPYSFRMTQTEVTNTQWLEFVEAYSTVNPNGNYSDWGFSGPLIGYSQNEPGNYGWYIAGGAENAPANMSWLYAARYVNWLQNGKAMTPAAFEQGVYDMSTFHDNGDLTWSGNSTRAPGSNFWIPNYDEWTKGMHFDPDRYGPGQPGYWLYENSSDSPPVGGPPGTPGAQTNAYSGAPLFMPVGSYPDQQSPWGLLDGSGGASEYLDGWHNVAFIRGAQIGDSGTVFSDRLDFPSYITPDSFFGGLRLASTIPAPGSVGFALIYCLFLGRKRYDY